MHPFFLHIFQHYKLDVEAAFPSASSSFLSPEQIQTLAGPVATQLLAASKLKAKTAEMMEDRRKSLASTCLQVMNHFFKHRILKTKNVSMILFSLVLKGSDGSEYTEWNNFSSSGKSCGSFPKFE